MGAYFSPRRVIVLASAVVVVLVLALVIFPRYYVDWLWFGEVSLRTVFWKRITLSVILGPVFGAVFFAIIYGNIEIARRLAPKYRPVEGIDVLEPIRETAVKRVRLIGLVLSLLLAIVVAFVTSGSWLTFAKALDAVSFGTKDPIFHHNLSFYVFSPPGVAVHLFVCICRLDRRHARFDCGVVPARRNTGARK